MLKYKEFTLDNMSSKAALLDNFYAIAWNKIKYLKQNLIYKQLGEMGNQQLQKLLKLQDYFIL